MKAARNATNGTKNSYLAEIPPTPETAPPGVNQELYDRMRALSPQLRAIFIDTLERRQREFDKYCREYNQQHGQVPAMATFLETVNTQSPEFTASCPTLPVAESTS